MKELKFHALANVFPLLTPADLAALADDIKENGLREPIVLFESKILDGRNRYLACRKAGVTFSTLEFKSGDPLAFVISKNLRRRHLNASQRSLIAARIATMKHGGMRDAASRSEAISQSQAAQTMNVSERLIRSANIVDKRCSTEIKKMVESGNLAISTAAAVASLAQSDQDQLARKGASAVVAKARSILKQPQKSGRAQFSALWPHVDGIIAGLNEGNLAAADLAARALCRAIEKVAAERRGNK